LGDKVSLVQSTAAVLERGDAASDSALVVAFGTRAFRAALAVRGGPILAALITRQSFDEALREAGRGRDPKSVSAVYLDQPTDRHFDLVHTMIPGVARVGVLVSPGDADSTRRLETSAGARKLSLHSELVAEPREIHAALTKLLVNCDAVLATPDPRIFNGGTLHNILLATYREGRPLFGFSPAYVRAGALAAVYSTPQHVARQLAAAVQRFLGGGGLPPPQHPQLFSVKINPTVARSLRVAVDDEQIVQRKLQALERER
jgi:putative tryptophan/tyrosine transport system substrate-binding protein